MLKNTPKPAFKRIIKYTLGTVFVAEALGFAVSYGLYYRLNTERGK